MRKQPDGKPNIRRYSGTRLFVEQRQYTVQPRPALRIVATKVPQMEHAEGEAHSHRDASLVVGSRGQAVPQRGAEVVVIALQLCNLLDRESPAGSGPALPGRGGEIGRVPVR